MTRTAVLTIASSRCKCSPRRSSAAAPASSSARCRPLRPSPVLRAASRDRLLVVRFLRGDAYAFGEPADAAFLNESGAPSVYLVAVSRR